MPHPFTFLLHSPEVARRVAHLGAYLRFETNLSPVERELAICTTAGNTAATANGAAIPNTPATPGPGKRP